MDSDTPADRRQQEAFPPLSWQELDENYHVFVTGANASMLSRELGSSHTGCHISKELYPFSYA